MYDRIQKMGRNYKTRYNIWFELKYKVQNYILGSLSYVPGDLF